jgi:hypothetical protein
MNTFLNARNFTGRNVADKLMQTQRPVTSGKKNHDRGLIKLAKTERVCIQLDWRC